MGLVHYEALLIRKHGDFAGPKYMERLSYTGDIPYDATTKLISSLEYFCEKDKVSRNWLRRNAASFQRDKLQTFPDRRGHGSPMPSSRTPTRPNFRLKTGLRSYRFGYQWGSDILHLVYIVSRQVFLYEGPIPLQPPFVQLSAEIREEDSPPQCEKTEFRLKPVPVNNWQNAFLYHTRGYLLLSTRVDYFMSVGRLPGDNSQPEVVCSMPPLGKIRLTWTLEQDHPRFQMNPDARFDNSKDESWISNEGGLLPDTNDIASSKLLNPTSDNMDTTRDHRAHKNQPPDPTSSPYLPLGNTSADSSAAEISGTTKFRDQGDVWETGELSTPYDTYISSMAHECFGSAPLENT